MVRPGVASKPASEANVGAAGNRGRRLARFTVEGAERELVALGEEGGVRVVDRRADGGEAGRDEREVEQRVACLSEAEALAQDYARLSRRLGRSAMPEGWW